MEKMDVEIEMQDKPKRNLKLLKRPLRARKDDFNEFVDTDNIKETEQKEKTSTNFLLIANIENIYLNLKNSDPFKKMKISLVFLFFISQTILWFIFDQMSDIKNNYYCYDAHSTYFEICDMKTFCREAGKGVTNLYFIHRINETTLNDKSTIKELNEINKLFRNYYFKEYFHFSVKNLDEVDKLKSFTNYYSTIVNVNYGENWNMFLAFRQGCQRETDLIIYGGFIISGLIFGNILFGFLADVFGRKTVLNLIILIQILGCLGIFLLSAYILSTQNIQIVNLNEYWRSQIINSSLDYSTSDFNTEKTFSEESSELFNRKLFSTTSQESKLSSEIYMSYLKSNHLDDNLDYEYFENFNTFTEIQVENKSIADNFNHFKIFLFMFFFLISSGISSGFNIILSLIFETSTNDRLIYRSYFIFSLGFIFSYFFHFILVSFINYFHFPFLIISILLTIAYISFKIFVFESPRHNFEFFEYDEITKTMIAVVNIEEVKLFMVNPENTKVEQEIGKYLVNKKESSISRFLISFLFFNLRFKLDTMKKNLINSEFFDVKRSDIIRNPFILNLLFKFNSNFKNKGLLLLSLIANISLNFCIIISNYSIIYITSRMDLYENYILNRVPFFLTVIMICSLYFFNLFLKFYGVKTTLFICFVMNFIFSTLYSVYEIQLNDPEDLNNFYLTDKNIFVGISVTQLRIFLGFLTFFGFGLYFTMFFYLMKFTKTIYRCLFLGICHVIIDFFMVFAYMTSHFCDVNMYYVTITSLFGMAITFLISGDMGYNIINDFRKIFIKEICCK